MSSSDKHMTQPTKRRAGRVPTPPTVPMRDRLLEVKREEIVRVASELFFTKGFTHTSMDEIAARLSIGKPQVYACFSSKTALLAEVCNLTTMLAANLAAEAKKSKGTPTERVAYVVRELSRRVIEGRINLAVLFREVKHLPQEGIGILANNFHSFNHSFQALLREGMKTGEFQIIHPAVVTHAISGMTTWMYSWFSPNGDLTSDEIVEEMVRLALCMVGVRESEESLRLKAIPSKPSVRSAIQSVNQVKAREKKRVGQ
jgi:TetR/AcrR family transcriptional regulator, cholesterol catabolism regulator